MTTRTTAIALTVLATMVFLTITSSPAARAQTTQPSAPGRGRGVEDSVTRGGVISPQVSDTYVETPGAHHDYQVWRVYLATNLPMLFRD